MKRRQTLAKLNNLHRSRVMRKFNSAASLNAFSAVCLIYFCECQTVIFCNVVYVPRPQHWLVRANACKVRSLCCVVCTIRIELSSKRAINKINKKRDGGMDCEGDSLALMNHLVGLSANSNQIRSFFLDQYSSWLPPPHNWKSIGKWN